MSEKDTSEAGPLGKTVDDVERAEEHLEGAHADETAAKREVVEATKEVERAEHDFVRVHVVHVNEVEHASFEEKRTATLQQVWSTSYTKLKIARNPKDVFQTGGRDPKSLMNYLGLTLEQAKTQKVIEDYYFGIASETGGA